MSLNNEISISLNQKMWLGMPNAQNIYQKHFSEIGTKIDGKNPQFGISPLDPYMEGGGLE
jgi:hypothetical protein